MLHNSNGILTILASNEKIEKNICENNCLKKILLVQNSFGKL